MTIVNCPMRRMYYGRLVRILAAALVQCSPTGVSAQQHLVVDNSKISCRECRIELVRLATFADREEAGHFSHAMMVTVDGRGLFHTVDAIVSPGQIRVFDNKANLIRTVGRDGAGPGEFRHHFPPFFALGDTAFVADLTLRRMTRLSPAGEYIDSHSLPGLPKQIIGLPGGGYLVNGRIGTPSAVGWPLHHVNRHGVVLKSFGADVAVLDPMMPAGSNRVAAFARPDEIWAALINRYVIERWTLQGKKTLIIERRAEWFQPWQRYDGPQTVVRPPATVHAVWEDDSQNLWVAISVADANWRRTDFQNKPGDMIAIPRSSKHDIYDTIIEVIDPRAGVLVATQRLPLHLQSMGNGQVFISYHEDEVGHPKYDVWRLRLTAPRRLQSSAP